MFDNIIIIACSIFKIELEHIINQIKIEIPVVYMDSLLHMNPEKLQKELDKKLEKYKNYKIILLYGDCHASMVDYEKKPNVIRSQGINCCEILLGSEMYHALRKQGAFILLPEWIFQWKNIFMHYMGFKNSGSCKLFMNDMHSKFVYINTGYQPIQHSTLKELTDYCGLPLEIYNTTISEFEQVVKVLIDKQVMN